MKPVDEFLSDPDPASRVYPVTRFSDGQTTHALDQVAEEVPVALEFNGISYAVMLATPRDLEDFAIGFSLSEGIVQAPAEIFDCEPVAGEDGITVRIQISAERCAALKLRRRAMAGRTGCGLCGAENLEQVVREQVRVSGTACFDAATLLAGFAVLSGRQRLMDETGAVHGAAWLRASGEVAWVREDVGRHNALDKLLGAAALRNEDFGTGAALITSRASFEMVQKSVALGITVLAAISAPTGLAIRSAAALGLTLVGFARGQSLACYAHPERVLDEPGQGFAHGS